MRLRLLVGEFCSEGGEVAGLDSTRSAKLLVSGGAQGGKAAGGRKRTKSASAAWVSCCSALVRIVASVRSSQWRMFGLRYQAQRNVPGDSVPSSTWLTSMLAR